MTKMNSSGKVLIVFSVIIAILLISLTAISLFFFQKEIERRKFVQEHLDKSIASEEILNEDLEEKRKQNLILEEKNKEADERINNLLDDLELQEGLREELKIENLTLKEDIKKTKKLKEDLEEGLNGEIVSAKNKIDELEGRLKIELDVKAEIQKELADVQGVKKKMEENLASLQNNVADLEQKLTETKAKKQAGHEEQESSVVADPLASDSQVPVAEEKIDSETEQSADEVVLDRIVISQSAESPEGRVLSVDRDTDFVIISIGKKDGVGIGNTLSVYRGKNYLGDIKVTRIQPSMSAADILPPFSSKLIRKNDLVVLKK
ncbi:MAG: DUF4407 domain-containing protein [Candidatus Omnitrophica bacterium]|nr:DUF4407 domain-containing protein [Candidatus Omnitrophota bacterium]